MLTNLIFIYIFISMIIVSFTITIIFFTKKERQNVRKYKNHCISHEKALAISMQDLKNESILRVHTEKKLQNELQKIYELYGKLAAAEERLKLLDHYRQQYEQTNHELHTQFKLYNDQKLKLNELNIRFEEHKLLSEKKEKLFINSENRLIMQFENLSNRIFDQHRHKTNEQSRLILDSILHPFSEQLNGFKNQIQDNFFKEEQARQALTYEIHNLHQLNAQITQETINLTKALKGNNKTQGNWGEVILTRVLEASGMREGHEFHSQISIKQGDGHKLQPDIIVHLPHGKDIIIDSKLSLIAYERYFNSDNEQDQNHAITEHIHSLRTHIKLLHKKDYQKLFGLNTLDYILMFIPIESAFSIAIEKESSLLTDAMNCNIMLVSPTTLLVALRTINNLWQYEYQNYHAKKIAEKAAKLYDKLRLFVDDLNKIGQYLNKTEHIYNAAKNKFYEGRGNIISQAESFRELGVQIKQPIIPNNTVLNDILLSKDQNNNTSSSTK